MMLFVFSRVISEAIAFSKQPEKPYVVVVGVNNTDSELIWEFVPDSGEDVQSILFERKKADELNAATETLATRGPSSGFTVVEQYAKDYAAYLNNKLQIKKVTNNQEYIYTILINFNENTVPQPPKRDEVRVVVKG